jgi:hypothetical protein
MHSCGVQVLFTKDELMKMGDPAGGRPMVAIMGEVYDVSAAPQYYGEIPHLLFYLRLSTSVSFLIYGFSYASVLR